MGGYPKQKQYQYNPDGSFVRDYESKSKVCDEYGLKKGNFYNSLNYRKLSDGTYIVPKRVGRQAIVKIHKIENCKFCNTNTTKRSKPVEVYNLLGEKLAEFTNIGIMEKMTNLDGATIHNQANSKHKSLPKQTNSLIFKYKQ